LTKYILNGIYKSPSEIFEFIIHFANKLKLDKTSYIDLVNLFIDKTPDLKSSDIGTILKGNNQNIIFSDIIIDNNRQNVGFNPELGINPFTSDSPSLENPLRITRKAKEEADRKAEQAQAKVQTQEPLLRFVPPPPPKRNQIPNAIGNLKNLKPPSVHRELKPITLKTQPIVLIPNKNNPKSKPTSSRVARLIGRFQPPIQV
jgi:hypothetical protein